MEILERIEAGNLQDELRHRAPIGSSVDCKVEEGYLSVKLIIPDGTSHLLPEFSDFIVKYFSSLGVKYDSANMNYDLTEVEYRFIL